MILVTACVAVIDRRANQCSNEAERVPGHVVDAIARRQIPDTYLAARNATRVRRGNEAHRAVERNSPRSNLRTAGATHEQPPEQQALKKRPALPIERERTLGTSASHEQTQPEVKYLSLATVCLALFALDFGAIATSVPTILLGARSTNV